MQPLPLASELFFAAWDTTHTGNPRIHRTGVALALAGGLLAELAVAERLAIHPEHLALSRGAPTGDLLLDNIMRTMAESAHTETSIWLAFLARQAITQVADRLINAELMTRVPPRVLKHRPCRYICTDAAWAQAAWSPDHLRLLVSERRTLTSRDPVLVALAHACGLLDVLLHDPSAQHRSTVHFQAVRRAVPPPMDSLAQCVYVAVGKAVLTYRT